MTWCGDRRRFMGHAAVAVSVGAVSTVSTILGTSTSAAAPAMPCRVGVTLHPYYAWTRAVVQGTDVEVVPILPGDVDAGAYEPRPADIARLKTLDLLLENGLGHDDFIDGMVTAAASPRLTRVNLNAETPTLPSAHGNARNSHTFLSLTNAMQQTDRIAQILGARLPHHAARFEDNAAAAKKVLRRMLARAQGQLAAVTPPPVVTVHDGYSYLLHELGLTLAAVVEPAHGLLPSAKELGEMVALLERRNLRVIFTEEAFPARLAEPLLATGARLHVLSHVAVGAYTDTKFVEEMQRNLDTIVAAVGGTP